MRIKSVAWLMALLLLVATLALTGCPPDEPEVTVVDEPIDDDLEPAEEVTPVDEEQDPAREELTAEEVEAVTQVQIDLDREYPHEGFEHLRSVLFAGRDEHKAEAQRVLQTLLLESRRPHTRQLAASVLGADPEPAVDALTTAALRDTESAVRRSALESLSNAPPSSELIGSLQQLQAAEDAEVRLTALMTEMELRMRDPEHREDTAWMERMLARVRDDASSQLQIRLVITGETVLPPLVEVLENAEDPHARAGAATAIMLICAGTSPQQLEFARLARTIGQEVLRESQPANLDGVAPLERALANDPAPEVRAVAAQGLGYLGQESSAPLLARALSDPNEEVRFWAALALETVPGGQAARALASAATADESERVRAAAVRALGWVDRQAAVLPLIRATNDTSSMVRQAAAEELGRFREPRSLSALTALFDDPSEDVRWAAVLAAGNLRDLDAVPDLVRAMRDPSPMVANAAERALQRMGRAERRFGTLDEI